MGSFKKDAPFQVSQVSFKRGARVADDEEEEKIPVDGQVKAGRAGAFGPRSRVGSSVTDTSSNSSSMNYGKSSRQDRIGSDSFWCNAFCMHLPSLSSRRRPIMQQQQSMSPSEPDAAASTAGPAAEAARNSAGSKVASMERFGNNSSAAASGVVLEGRVDDDEEEDDDQEMSAYFDLPLELLRSSSVDMESPVTAAFLFDSSRGRGRGRKKSMLPDHLDFSFPAPPAFSSPPSPPS